MRVSSAKMLKAAYTIVISLLTLLGMSSDKSVARPRCDAKDALMAEVYKDPWFSDPKNHKKRNSLIEKIAKDENLCKYFRD